MNFAANVKTSRVFFPQKLKMLQSYERHKLQTAANLKTPQIFISKIQETLFNVGLYTETLAQ